MRLEPCDPGLVVFHQLNAKGHIVRFQPLEAPIPTFENGRIVTGAEVNEISCCRIQFGKKGSCETAILTVGTNLSIQTSYKFRERTADTCESSQAGLKRGHQHRCGHALTRNIGHG